MILRPHGPSFVFSWSLCSLWVIAAGMAPWLVACGSAADANEPKPNILVIVSDNQGWKDIGYHGSEIRTPTLDALAASGVRLEHFYVYTMCSPTRAAFISGRAPSRYGILGAIGYRSRQALPSDIVTVADSIRAAGYETAISGKWHVGLRPEVGPLQYGFDQSYGFFHGQIDKLTHRYKNGDRTWHRNDQYLDEEGHSLDLITDEAIRFIERDRDRPFFLYVPYGAPHPPLQEAKKWVEPYRDVIQSHSRRLYAASVTHMDHAIGQLLDALDRTGQRENTLVVFFSDNGAIPNWPVQPKNYEGRFGPYPQLGDNGKLRGWIGDLYDGCVRTPALVNWPGVLSPHVLDEVTSVLDLYPTLVARCGGSLRDEWQLEGRDIWPLLTRAGKVGETTLYWKSYNGQKLAVRHGRWKLHVDRRQNTRELYDMEADPYESKNLADKQPQRLQELSAVLEAQAAMDL